MPFLIDFHLLAQAVLYFTSVACGLVISIPTGVTKVNFGGRCLLYTQCSWINDTYFTAHFGSAGSCDFIVYASVFVGIFYAVAMGAYYIYALTRKDPNTGSQMWVLPFIVINSLACFTFFTLACIISVGLKTFCDTFTAGGNHASSCADAENPEKLRWFNPDKSPATHGNFYSYLHAAEGSGWVMFFVWAAQVGLGIFRLYRNRRKRSQESFPDSKPVEASSDGKAEDLNNFAADVQKY